MSSALRGPLDRYLAHLRVERGLSVNTLAAYERDLTRYVDYLASRGVADLEGVTPGHVTDFVAHLRDEEGGAGLSAASAGRTVVAVRGWHRFCALEGLTPTDPADGVHPPRPARRLPKAISTEEVERLLRAAGTGSGPVPLRDAALLELLYATGARISEIVALDVDDLDLDASTPAVRLFGKGRRERLVPVGSWATRAVGAYLSGGRPSLVVAGRGTAALFVNRRGARLSRQSAWEALQRAADAAGLAEHVSPHTLRHSFATHMLAGGADIRVVQELLGHASVTTTQIYTLVTLDDLRQVYASSHPRALD